MNTFFSPLTIDIVIPKYIAAFFIGLNLSISGFLMQVLTKNSLADTKIMGVSSGGLVSVAILNALNIPFQNFIYFPVVFMGCVLSTLIIFLITLGAKNNSLYVLLSGIGISSLLYSIAISIFILNHEDLLAVYAWSAGSLSNVTWSQIYFLLPISIVIGLIAYLISPSLKIYELGKESALSLGLNYNLYSFFLIVLITFLASSAVSVCGTIGFIGLLVPNLFKILFTQNYKKIVLFSALFGGFVLVAAQKVSQLLSTYQDVPVGCMTALIGAVFLLARNIQWKSA